MTDLTGKRAIVTGASGGLGLHFAKILAAAGAEVTLAARRKEKLEAAVAREEERPEQCCLAQQVPKES